jgi:hypothetical protein
MNMHDGAKLSQVCAARVTEESASFYKVQFPENEVQGASPLQEVMSQFFLSHFKTPEWYCFTDTTDHTIYEMVCEIFDDPQLFTEKALQLVPYYRKINPEDVSGAALFMAYFPEVAVGDEMTEAIGIFKVNMQDTFLQLISAGDKSEIEVSEGIFTGQPQMGCMIVNAQKSEGFKVWPSFSNNRSSEAAFWRDSFLRIVEAPDDYHHTKHYIQATKKFIRDKMPEVMEMDKAAEAAMMQRSFEYFKGEENFDVEAYEVKVFKDREVVEAFRDFREAYDQEKPGMLAEQFEISESAVKKQSNVFKSVIKLDKNFHIYVHGDRSKIRKGTDEEGKKFYMIYYEDES